MNRRAWLLKFSVAAGCACGFVLSRRLWLSSVRSYPHAPVTEVLTPPAYPPDFAWLGALFALPALAAVSARPRKYLAAFLFAGRGCSRSGISRAGSRGYTILLRARRAGALPVGGRRRTNLSTSTAGHSRSLYVPAYPEKRIFRRVARGVCGRGEEPSNVTLEIRGPLRWWGGAVPAKTLDCASLTR